MAERSAPPDAFGRAAEEYELGRPEWPAELIDQVGLPHDAEVLDLGAGTGKLTRLLVSRFARVVAVEPDDAMRAVLERVVPKAEAYAGAAEAIPLPDASVDAVFSAEAFHWFASPEVVGEIGRVLRHGGAFAFVWNIPEGEMEPEFPEEADRLLDEAFAKGGAPGLPKVLSGEWRAAFEGSRFGDLHEAELERWIEQTRDQLVAQLLSISSIAALSDDERRDFGERFGELVPDVRWRSRYRTVAYWTRLG
ncbi:MAG: methyltransferase domain-containing protein [Actinomycetota bacterium]|nr:methyltransferase domain-containing protein [Actinomycetota bacterium]